MKTLICTLIAVLLAMVTASGWADPPATPVEPAATEPSYTSYYTGQITAIGQGTIDLHVFRGHSGIIHPVNVHEKTVVVLADGKAGKLSDLKVGQWVKVYWNPDPNNPKEQRIVRIEPGKSPWATQEVAETPAHVDPKKAATAEVVVRGTLQADPAGPGRGGWPTYTMTVAQVFKTPKDMKIEVGQKLTVKTIKEFKGPVTLYLVFDKDQNLYRLQDPMGERGFSHVDAGGGLFFDEYSGYFVSNKFEPDAAESFVVLTDQAQFDQVFGVAFVMNDKSHRLPKDAFKTLMVIATIKRGNAFWEYKVEGVTEDMGVVQLRYKATAKKTPETVFSCPLIVSVPKGKYKAVEFVEGDKKVKTVELDTGRAER